MAKHPNKSEAKPTFSRTQYDKLMPTLEAVREEVAFVLRDDFEIQKIKIHGIESRVKTFNSWRDKLAERAGDDEFEIEDMVGARAVCLFKSDIDIIDQRIHELFSVIRKDDKVTASDDSFGYMSIHYICLMKDSYKGPRYNRIKDIKFEIQVRTLCMHAWAAISHYLDYKSEWDIPEHLRKGLNALSGLFYVADEQYERLYDARQESKKQADEEAASNSSAPIPVNLDTIIAYGSATFPDRQAPTMSEASNIVQELNEANYASISSINSDVQSAMGDMLKDEEDTIRRQNESRNPFYTQMGAIRTALSIANPTYKDIVHDSVKRRVQSRVTKT